MNLYAKLLIAFTLFCAPQAQAKDAPLRGLADPTLAFGVSLLRDWETAKPFINMTKFMRPFKFSSKQGGNIRSRDLPKDTFDENGWVKRIPKTAKFAATVWHWNKKKAGVAQNKGDYVLTYEGDGQLDLKLDAHVIKRKPGRIEFRNKSGGPIYFRIRSTDPGGTGNYIRNIVMVRKEYEKLHQAGAVFNPRWLAAVSDARQIRFMNWMQTNGSNQENWSDRPRLTDATWVSGKGTPVEVMVRLANEIGADPWFTMPHNASEAYNRAFANYVRDHLDPRLKAYVEHSNELWNGQFRQAKKLIASAKKEGGRETRDRLAARNSYATMQIWSDVFGADAERRLVRVLGSWQASPDWSKKLLSHRAPKGNPNQHRTIAQGFDALAVSTYIGGDKKMVQQMHKAWKKGGDTHRNMKAIFTDEALFSSPAKTLRRLRHHAALAHDAGLKLISYEGGQHLHTRSVIQIGGAKFNYAIEQFVYSDEMADIYEDLWRSWRDIGDGPFMQFTAVAQSSKSGSWGLQRYLGEESLRWRKLMWLNARTPNWWGDKSGAQYQQGDLAGESGLIGTAEEDYLIGGDADDTFYPAAGSDGINGGSGHDVVVLPKSRSAYSIRKDGGRVSIIAGNTTKTLFSVEELRFSDGASMQIKD